MLAGAILLASGVNALEIKQQGNIILFDELDTIQYQAVVRLPNGNIQTFNINNGNFALSAEVLGLEKLENGLYKYELTPIFKASNLTQEIRKLNDADVSAEYTKSFSSQNQSISGVFTIANNLLADKNLIDPATVSMKSSQTIVDQDVPPNSRDQVILDDLIVDGSVCIGFDCVNGESFGFDTLRLKENNLRIRALDTSASASFPSNDWQITFNDTSNGGANKFSIDDIDGGRTPFTLEAGAPSHSLYVDDGGRIGLGTNNPVVQIHVKDGNTPTLRLEQDGSAGFTPQTWDVAGNEAGFFIRDATNGSNLSFRIRPGAPASSIDIAANGNVGIGRTLPGAKLDVAGTVLAEAVQAEAVQAGTVLVQGDSALLTIENNNTAVAGRGLLTMSNNGGSFITMTNTAVAKSWYITHENSAGTSFNIAHDDGGVMRLTTAGDLSINGTLTTTGTICSVGAQPAGCDLVFSDDYKLPTIEEHAEEMYSNSYLPNVGPTIENAPFNLTEKTGGMLNELEKAHIYIAQLNEKLNEKTSKLASIEKRLAKLESK